MPCTRQFLNFTWTHHHWRPRVTAAEIMTVEEPDMWARPVQRDYVRCDKAEVCEECGAVRHEVSCMCDMARGEKCAIRLEHLARKEPAA